MINCNNEREDISIEIFTVHFYNTVDTINILDKTYFIVAFPAGHIGIRGV